jgi:hypothetical protein
MEEGMALLSIQIIPYKLTQKELEARLAPGLTVLPGQLLRFEGLASVYGQVKELRILPDAMGDLHEGQVVQIALLRGSPSLEPITITPLTPQQMVEELVQLLPTPEHPLDLQTFQGDYLRLGALTLVTGGDFLSKYEVLLALMEAVKPYQKILVLDPIGIFESVGDVSCYTAGNSVRLGLQEVSGKRFLDAFGGLFPAGVRKPVTETVASHWPESGAFSGFSPLLVSGMITESLLKNLILQNCAHVIRNKVFAEAPEQVLDLKKLSSNPVSVLDLSGLQEPWKSFFYQEAMAQVFSNPELGLIPVLIYPENYLPDFDACVKRADEFDFRLLGLTSPYVSQSILNLANNTVSVITGQVNILQGDLTLGLPVAFGNQEAGHEKEGISLAQEEAAEPVQAVLDAEEPPSVLKPASAIFETEPEKVYEEEYEAAPGVFQDLPALPPNSLEPTPVFQQTEPETDEPLSFLNTIPPLEMEDFLMPEAEVESDDALTEEWVEQDFASEVPSALAFTAPVVDLSSPNMEAVPSFLTAEQLSDLLNREALTPSSGMSDASGDTDTEENRVPDPMEKPPGLPPLTVQESMHSDPAAFPIPDISAAVSTSGQAFASASAPSFPEPEEFEKDEFDFDINLDHKVEQLTQQSLALGSHLGEGALAPPVSSSLNQFDDLSQPPETPLLEFDAEPLAKKLAQQQETWSVESVDAGLLAGGGIQDALDSIYPRSPQAAAGFENAPSVAVPANLERQDESLLVIQKKPEIPIAGETVFKAGDKVQHASYGLGIVQKVIPVDQSVILNITFENVGKRLLDPALTQLSRL